MSATAAEPTEGEDAEPRWDLINTAKPNVTIVVVDLFAGGGGLSHGLARACEQLRLEPGVDVELHAINHSEAAIETHEANHPWANHYHAKIEALHPPDVAEPGTVDVLSGGPSCTHHSSARGGKPKNEQLRSSAWKVLEWVEMLQPEHVLIENVPEFRTWDPIDPETGESEGEGRIYIRFCKMLEAMGLTVGRGDHEYGPEGERGYGRVLRCANYGDPTTRRRLFVIASRNHEPSYPEPTHGQDPDPDSGLEPWVPASECIDWSDLGTSLFTRDLEKSRVTPPKNSTWRRIAEGLRRHHGPWIEPFADAVAEIGDHRDVAEGNEIACTLEELRESIIPVEWAGYVAQRTDTPFLVRCPAGNAALASPFMLRQQDGATPVPIEEDPVPTIPAGGAFQLTAPVGRSLIQPKNGSQRGIHSNEFYPPEEVPWHTITTDWRAKLATTRSAYLVPGYSERPGQRPRTRSVDRPLMTVPASRTPASLTTAFIDDFQGPPDRLDQPVGTLHCEDRFALCVPEVWPWGLDLRYRMLKPSELKQAQGFPADYELVADTKDEKKTLIGNAVPVKTGTSLFLNTLTIDDPTLSQFGGGIQGDPNVEIPDYQEVTWADD